MANNRSSNPDDSSHNAPAYDSSHPSDVSNKTPDAGSYLDDFYQNTYTGKALGSILGYKKGQFSK